MKKVSVILFTGVLLLFVSCTPKKESGMSDKAKKNLEAMRGINNSFITKDFSKLGDYVHINCIDHAGGVKGLAEMKAQYEKWAPVFDITKSEVIKEIADDEYVFSWMRYSGTMRTDGMNMKAGDKFEKTSLEVARYADGKVIEHWTFVEPSEMARFTTTKEK